MDNPLGSNTHDHPRPTNPAVPSANHQGKSRTRGRLKLFVTEYRISGGG
jgi:hypothetical protein